jgi:hypothetical protein
MMTLAYVDTYISVNSSIYRLLDIIHSTFLSVSVPQTMTYDGSDSGNTVFERPKVAGALRLMTPNASITVL